MPPVNQINVAAKANVSRSTVSNVFCKPEIVKPKIRERVLQVAEELGYRPNTAARSVRGGKFDCVAFLHDAYKGRSDLPKELIYGVGNALSANDMYMIFAHIEDKELSANDKLPPKILRQVGTDGLLLNYQNTLPAGLEKLIIKTKQPCVWINADREFNTVLPDDFNGSKELTEHLISLGHKKIIYIDYLYEESESKKLHFSKRERTRGYYRAMQNVNLEAIVKNFNINDNIIEILKHLFRASNRPTAIICSGADLLKCAFEAALTNGIKIPSEISLASFATKIWDIESYSAMILPWYQIGYRAGEMLIEKINNNNLDIKSEYIKLSLDLNGNRRSISSAPKEFIL